MIQAVSNFTTNNSNVKAINYYAKSNYISRASNSNQLADTFTNSNYASKISFAGAIPSKLIQKKGRKLAGKVSKEAAETASKAIRKLNDKELPVVEKSLVAAMEPAKKLVKDQICDVIDNIADKGGDCAPTGEIYILAKCIKWLAKIVKHYDDLG